MSHLLCLVRQIMLAMLLVSAAAGLALAQRGGPAEAQAQPPVVRALRPASETTPGPAATSTTTDPAADSPASSVELGAPAAATFAPDQPLATATRTPTPINIGNLVWDDLDADGVQDAGEPGIAGVTIQLWNAAKTQLLDQAVTNASGNYTVVAPLSGDYRIRVLLPSVLDTFTTKDAGADDLKDSEINPTGINFGFSDTFTIASNVISITTIDAGMIIFRPPTPTRTPTPINIGNLVWVDLDADGLQDAGEPGLGGVTVQLWNADRTQLIGQAVTSAGGIYTVVAPLPGDYRIRVLLPAGASFAPKDTGADDLKDSDINRQPLTLLFGFSDVFTLASNVISTTIHDAGLINVPATPIPTMTSTATLTPAASPEERDYLPLIVRIP